MNIFFLDKAPRAAARMLCDKHVPKMLLESVQMLSTVSHLRGGPAPYKPTHVKHPCVQWANKTYYNLKWLLDHAFGIKDEYELRFEKTHKSSLALVEIWQSGEIPRSGPLTPPAQAMPEIYRCNDVIRSTDVTVAAVKAYRAYYKGAKAKFARWERGTPAPEWWHS